MARPNDLIPGNCYFLVGYHDRDLLIPSVETLIFRRTEEDDNGERIWLFEEPGCSDDSDDGTEPEPMLAIRDDMLYQVLDFDGLLLTLKEVSEYHPLTAPSPVASPVGINHAVLAELQGNVQKFVDSPELYSVTVTILFRDDGLSLGRRKDGGFEMGFFPHPKLDPAEELKLLKFFEGIGIAPHVDYLADKGRTRILEFSIPSDPAEIIDLCVRVLTEVYEIRDDETLKYSFLQKR